MAAPPRRAPEPPPAAAAATLDELPELPEGFPYSESYLARMPTRTEYMRGRFAKHAPRWQFVVWSRQLALMITAYGTRALVAEDATVQAELVWGHALLALLILVLAWRLHARVRPYEYHFQNVVEDWLFVSNMLVVALGTVYTALFSILGTVDSLLQRAVEAVLTAVLVATIVLSGAYLARCYRHQMLELKEAEARQRIAERRSQRASEPGLVERLRAVRSRRFASYRSRASLSPSFNSFLPSFRPMRSSTPAYRARGGDVEAPAQAQALPYRPPQRCRHAAHLAAVTEGSHPPPLKLESKARAGSSAQSTCTLARRTSACATTAMAERHDKSAEMAFEQL